MNCTRSSQISVLSTFTLIILFSLFDTTWIHSQTNEWSVHPDATIGDRGHYAINYLPELDQFLLNLGSYAQVQEHTYPDLIFDNEKKRWINYLPDSLYGVWADSTGNMLQANKFNGYYFEFREHEGHSLPQLIHLRQAAVHHQYAFNSIDNKIYYYLNNFTFSYDPIAKEYEKYDTGTHPSAIEGNSGALKWASMCFDPINNEVLLIGGTGVDAEGGNAGFWSFGMDEKEWFQKANSTVPPPRAYGNMVYDPSQEKILLFGGDHLDFLYSDTWEYDCKTQLWRQLSPEFSPSPRGGHLMLYSEKSQKLFLMGGYHYVSNSSYLSSLYNHLDKLDLWTYDWENESWNFVKEFDYNDSNVPNSIINQPNYLTGGIDADDQLLIVADDRSQYYYRPRTFQMNLDLSQIDEEATETQGVTQGTVERRTGAYAPEYFENNMEDLALDFYDLMPLDTWVKVPVGEDKYPENNRDWGTTVFDPDRNLFYKWAGGHSAHCGTDVPIYDAEKSHWRLPFYGDFPLEYCYANSSNPGYVSFNDRPFIPGHTYDGYDYDINLKKMITVGRKHSFTFDPDIGAWDKEKIPNPENVRLSYYHLSLTSTKHGVLFRTTFLNGMDDNSLLFLFNSETNSWDRINFDGPTLNHGYCDKAGAVYDSNRDRMIFVARISADSTAMVAYNFETNTSENLSPTNQDIATSSGLYRESVYIPSLDIVLYQIDINENHKLIYDCKENKWDSLRINKSADVGTTSTRSSGYMYDEKRNIIYDCESNCEVYALRLSGSTPTALVEKKLDNRISLAVFPNPTTGILNIDADGRIIEKVDVFNSLGELVLARSDSGIIDLSKLAKGVYHLEIKVSGVDKMTQSVVVE